MNWDFYLAAGGAVVCFLRALWLAMLLHEEQIEHRRELNRIRARRFAARR